MIRRLSLGLGAFCWALLALAAPAQAQTTGISGRVTNGSSAPVNGAAPGGGLQSVTVSAYTSSNSVAGSATTDASGNYTISSGLTGGQSYFVVAGNVAGLMDQVYRTAGAGGPITCGGCAPSSVGSSVAVTSGSVTPSINFALRAGPRISGRVTNANGSPLQGVTVRVSLQSNSSVGVAFPATDASGNFTSVALPPGTYAAVTSNSQGYIDRLYNGLPCPGGTCGLASGTGIVVGSADVAGIDFALPTGGFITGTVTNNGGTPLLVSGANISIYNSAGNLVTSVNTNASGVYTTSGLPEGTYFARAQVFSGPALIPQLYSGIPCLSCSNTSGTPITVAASSSATANFALDPSGTLQGTLRDSATTAGIANGSVQLYTPGGAFVRSIGANASGVYTVTGLSTGTYIVRAFGPSGGSYVSKVYAGAGGAGSFNCLSCDVTGGTPVSVTGGGTTSGIDFLLQQGGSITGTVLDNATGGPISGVSVTVLNTGGGFVASASTNSSGAYTIPALLAGTYYVRTNSSASSPYTPEIYAGAGAHVVCNFCNVAAGTAIPVALGTAVTGINFRLNPGVSISGTVTGPSGPLLLVSVTAFDGSNLGAGGISTNSSGQYTIAGLTPGIYYVKAFGGAGLMDQLYNGIACQNCSANGGTPIDLTTGSKTGINFTMVAGGRISGRIFDNNGVALGSSSLGIVGVSFYNESGSPVGSATADASGDFITATGLPTGKYYALSFNGFGYINTLYNNIGCFGCPATSGTQIPVTAGSTTSGINLTLQPGAIIRGTLKSSASGTPPIANAFVQVYSPAGSFLSSTSTNSLGNYTFGGLPTGSYFIRTSNGVGFVDQLYAGATCLACDVTTGTPVPATAGATTTGIDFTLAAGGNLAGTVKNAVTSAPLGSVSVQVYNTSGLFITSASSQANGAYIVKGLGAGTYFVRTSNSLGYINLLHGSPDVICGSCSITAGKAEPVTAGATTSGIDFALNIGGTLKGSVKTSDASATPISGVSVSVVTSTGSSVASNSTDLQGNYTVSGIVPGDYFVKTFNSKGFIDEVYSGLECVNCTVTAGTPVTIAQGAIVTGKDFALSPGGRISGTVTDNASTPSPLPGVTVNVYRANGSFATLGTTTALGTYVSNIGLPPGDYVVKTSNSFGYVDKLYDSITCLGCNVSSGKIVTLTGAASLVSGEAGPVSAVTSTTGINFALAAGGGISGSVKAADGTPLQGVFVQIYTDAGSFLSSTSTNGLGTYVLKGLPTGNYFARTSNAIGYIDQLWQSISCAGCSVTGGKPIPVTVGSVAPNIDFSLTAGGRISGTVTAAAGGAPIASVSISVYSTAGVVMASGFTSPAGTYVTSGLPAGNYLVRTSFNSSGFINMVHGSPADIICQSCASTIGAPVAVTLGAATTVSFSLAVGGSITGTVLAAGGAPVQFNEVSVSAYTAQGAFLGSGSTNGSGVYRVSGLPAGSYVLRTSNSVGFIDQQYDGQVCLGCAYSTATPVSVTAGAATGPINFALTRGGRISGTVKDAANNPLSTISVQIYSSSNTFVTSVGTDNLGNYVTRAGLPAGTYYARTSNSTGWINAIYPSNTCQNCPVTVGSPIAVATGNTTPNINFSLAKGGRLTGAIRDAVTGLPLGGVSVNVYLSDGTSVGGTSTNSSGGYSTQGLPTGTYFVRTSNGLGYVNRLYDAKDCVRCAVSNGTPVGVTAGEVKSGIDFALSPGGRISGVVTDAATGVGISGAGVTVVDAAGFGVTSATTNAAGLFTTSAGLTAGNYYVRTQNNLGYVNKLYDTSLCLQCNPLTGKPVAVTTGATTSGIDFALSAGGRIAGTVSGEGRGLTGARVDVFTSGGTLLTFVEAGTGGQYLTGEGLPSGTYYLVTQNISGFIDQLYDGNACGFACAVTTGTPVAVAAGATTAGRDFNLTAGGRISGRVTDKVTGNGVANARVDIINATGVTIAYGVTDGLGNYKTYGGVATGTYFAKTFYSNRTTPYVSQVYNGVACPACNPLTGTPIAVTSGGVASGIDFALETGETISGTVTDAGTTEAITGALVYLFNSTGGIVGSGRTDDAGVYVITFAVPAGTYYARTNNGLGYVDKLYDNALCLACDVTRGTPIVVDGLGETTGINFALPAGGRITGTVTAASGGTLVAGSAIRFFNPAGSFVGQTYTNGVGVYSSPGLPAGNYYVRTANASGLIDELYPNAPCAPCTLSQGTAVTVTGGLKSGIDFALDAGGLISGYVKDQATGSPIKGVTVSIYRVSDGVLVATTDPTDANGYYRISLPVGTYQAEPNPLAGFRPALAALRGQAARSTVVVDTGTETTGVGFALVSCPALTVTPSTLSLATFGQLYSKTIVATGGTAPYAFSLADGAPTPGLGLTASGVLTGVPAAAGTATFTAAAVDANGCAGTSAYSLFTCTIALTVPSAGVTAPAGSGSVQFLATSVDCPWVVTANVPWITITSAAAGTGPSTVTYSYTVNPSPTTPRTGTITVGGQTYTVIQAATTTQVPFGVWDTPVNGTTNVAGAIAIGGWALDDVGVARVQISRDPVAPEAPGAVVFIGDGVFVTGARPDVAANFPAYPNANRAGWGYLLLTNVLPPQGNGPGNGTYVLHIDFIDAEGNRVRAGDRTITVSNSAATKPFGTIDTPPQGAVISGTAYVNFGWILTPLPKTMPTNGSTIKAYVDGVLLGNVDYNHYRSDIAATFPGLNNTGDATSGAGAVGFRVLDTTQFTDGVHTIGWLGYDDQGVGEGVGSRYFTILNGSGLTAAPSALSASQAAALNSAAVPPAGKVWAAVGAEPVLELAPDGLGVINLTLGALERMELQFGAAGCVAGVSGGPVKDGRIDALPIGSTLRNGRFYWQPGPAFNGDYELAFKVTGCSGAVTAVTLNVRIVPSR